MRLIYQEDKDQDPIYEMYQKIFEDPEQFAQYYFEEVYKTNQVLLAKEDDKEDKIVGMIHLNPYRIKFGTETYTLNYIVAVAVWKEYRRRGIMAAMLKKCLNDMNEQRQPFTYLMPADRAYYEPFQFRFVMDWRESLIDQTKVKEDRIRISEDNVTLIRKATERDYQQISTFLQTFMNAYKIYTIPDELYLKRLAKESKSGDGNLMLYEEDGRLQGVFAESFEDDEVYIRWSYSEKPEQMLQQLKHRYTNKKIYITEGNLTEGKKVPKIMARITNLAAWENILEGKCDFKFRLLVKDPYIKKQNGVFWFECLDHKISIRRVDAPEWEDEISIDELTQVFFDYNAGQILKQHKYLKDIVPAGPIYISEEV